MPLRKHICVRFLVELKISPSIFQTGGESKTLHLRTSQKRYISIDFAKVIIGFFVDFKVWGKQIAYVHVYVISGRQRMVVNGFHCKRNQHSLGHLTTPNSTLIW